MKLVLAIALIVLGVRGLTYGGISFTHQKKDVDLGPNQVSHETRDTLPLPPVASYAVATKVLVPDGALNVSVHCVPPPVTAAQPGEVGVRSNSAICVALLLLSTVANVMDCVLEEMYCAERVSPDAGRPGTTIETDARALFCTGAAGAAPGATGAVAEPPPPPHATSANAAVTTAPEMRVFSVFTVR